MEPTIGLERIDKRREPSMQERTPRSKLKLKRPHINRRVHPKMKLNSALKSAASSRLQPASKAEALSEAVQARWQ